MAITIVEAAAFGAAGLLALGGAVVGARAWQRRRAADAARAAAAVELAAQIDSVTGLMSRPRFESVLQDTLAEAEKQGADCCVVHVALDDFRLVAEAGTPLADKALATVAARLRALIGSATPLARVAREEFAACLIAPRQAGETLALRITQAVPAPMPLDGHDLELAVSVGLAVAPEHGSGLRLLGKAAVATQSAQRAGGGAHAVFDPRIEAEHNSELAVARDLKEAVGKGQLELFFQPEIDARRLEVTTVEALLRWRHPAMGLVSPTRFVPIAERQGLIEPLGQWVVDGALKQLAAWRGAGLDVQVAVNVAGQQFRRDDFAAALARSLKNHGVPAGKLVCEIAEAVALEDTEATQRAFARLHKLGVRLGIGDFGGHDAGLAALATLPVHEVKIARSLIAALPNDGDARLAVQRIVAAAHARQLRVVAEGIENEAQRDQAVQLGCDELQGFLFARPMSARAVAIWSVDASRNLAQTLRPSQFKDTQPYVPSRPGDQAFAQTRISLRR